MKKCETTPESKKHKKSKSFFEKSVDKSRRARYNIWALRADAQDTNPMGIRIMVVQRTLTPPVGVRSSHPQPHRSSPAAAVFLYGV